MLNFRTSRKRSKQEGITIVALVITIIILLILSGISINMVSGGEGIFGRAKNSALIYRNSVHNENIRLDDYENEITKGDIGANGVYNEKQRLNAPILKQGMTPVKFEIDENNTDKMKIVPTTADDENWYNYKNKQWANAKTEDGSLWVWIPRYAYKLNKSHQTVDVVFLAGLTDKYEDENNKMHSDTKRCMAEDEVIDTEKNYIVHPAFTNESSINYRNGGWDSELYGIWVSKFEAAYASKDDDEKTKANVSDEKYNVSCGLNYSQDTVIAPRAVYAKYNSSATGNGPVPARNHLDGTYGETESKTASIKYPTFQGSSYSMNYINHNDAYLLSRSLTKEGNIYGLTADTDSHLIKNSEWGATAYLSKSIYGINTYDIKINNKNIDNNSQNVYAATGYNSEGKEWNDASINIDKSSSTTGNIYGIYDMNGGTYERTASYIENELGKSQVSDYGESIANDKNTKYVMSYKSDEASKMSADDSRSMLNYDANDKVYGDAIYETSSSGTDKNSWNNNYSYFPEGTKPFFVRSGHFLDNKAAGIFCFSRDEGGAHYITGFRAVLV